MTRIASFFALAALALPSTYALTDGTVYAISPASFPNLCLAPSAASQGAHLVTVDCESSETIGFKYDATTTMFANTADQMCIDVRNGQASSGNRMQVWGCFTDQRNQRFTISGNMIQWAGTNFCLDLKDGVGQVGTSTQIWSCGTSNPNQQWTFAEVDEVNECSADNSTVSSVATPAVASTTLTPPTNTSSTISAAEPTSTESDEDDDLPECEEDGEF